MARDKCSYCDKPAVHMAHCDTCIAGGGGAFACGEHADHNVRMMVGAHVEMGGGGGHHRFEQDERGSLIRFVIEAGHGFPAGTHTVRFLVRPN